MHFDPTIYSLQNFKTQTHEHQSNELMTNEQMVSHLFLQVAGQDVCFIEEGDVTFPPGETERIIQTPGCVMVCSPPRAKRTLSCGAIIYKVNAKRRMDANPRGQRDWHNANMPNSHHSLELKYFNLSGKFA